MTLDTFALWVVRALAVYCGIGLVFGLAFVTRGVERIDPSARQATWGFRMIALPGTMALWPWLLLRWRESSGERPVERNAHRRAARERRAE